MLFNTRKKSFTSYTDIPFLEDSCLLWINTGVCIFSGAGIDSDSSRLCVFGNGFLDGEVNLRLPLECIAG